jgi:hypothetical protein
MIFLRDHGQHQPDQSPNSLSTPQFLIATNALYGLLETIVTHSKQTTAPSSNRYKRMLVGTRFSSPKIASNLIPSLRIARA